MEQTSSTTSTASEIVTYPVTSAPDSPRKAFSLDFSRESGEYTTYTSLIPTPGSPLEGRHLKVGFAKAPNKPFAIDPILCSPQVAHLTVPKEDLEDDEMVSIDDLVVSTPATGVTQSPVPSNASSYYTARMFMSIDMSHLEESELDALEEEKASLPVVQENDGGANTPQSGTVEESPQRLLHIAQVLQRAARQTRDQQAYTQSTAFRTIVPFLLFVSVLVIGVILPRNYSTLKRKFGTRCNTAVPLLILCGLGCILLLLRAVIWLISALGQAFCDMDLTPVLRQGECRSVDGTRMREGDLIVGNFLLGG